MLLVRSGLLALVLGAVLLSACSSAELRWKAEVDPGTSVSGIKYFLPRDVLELEATRTVRLFGSSETTEILLAQNIDLRIKSVADTAKSYVLDLDPGSVSDSTLKVELTSDSRLRGISVQTQGKAGDVIKSLGSIVGTVGGTAASFVIPKMNELKEVDIEPGKLLSELQKKEDDSKELRSVLDEIDFQVVQSFPDAGQASELKNRARVELVRALKMTGVRDYYMLAYDPHACRVWVQLQLFRYLHTLEFTKLSSSVEPEKVSSARRDFLASRVQSLVQEYDALLLGYYSAPRVVTQVITLSIPIEQLSEEADTQSSVPLAGDAYALAKTMGLFITYHRLNTPSAGTDVVADPGKGAIWYRSPEAVEVIVRQCTEAQRTSASSDTLTPASTMSWQVVKRVHALVVLAGTKPSLVEFEADAFSQRNLSLSLDDSGRMTLVQRDATSSAAGAAGSSAAALEALKSGATGGLDFGSGVAQKLGEANLALRDLQAELLDREKKIAEGKRLLAEAEADLIRARRALEELRSGSSGGGAGGTGSGGTGNGGSGNGG